MSEAGQQTGNREQGGRVLEMSDDQYADAEEAAAAIRQLSDSDHQKLVVISRYWHRQRVALDRLGIAADDLLHQAILSTLEGERRWRRNSVTIVRHLDQCMRSISGHAIESAKTEIAGKREVRRRGVLYDRRPHDSSVEAQVIARGQGTEIEELFSDDPVALQVIKGRALGKEAEEIRTELSLDRRQYETTSRRILRKFAKFSLTN